ncbi:MAG: right-handed parallel beta-helix repeat-containing protein, partial [Gammaproteobacteria bacterium]|nr:right-handed parallel beta-helix repeat-containing protein [Gammaproteobacteria bacterium]
ELIIQGDVDNQVLLTSAASNPSKRDWKGIVVQDGATVSLDHVIVEYAEKAIVVEDGATVSLDHVIVEHAYRAIDLSYVTGATVTVSNSELRNIDYGVYIIGGDSELTITDSTLTDNYYGVDIAGGDSAVTITDSRLTDNSTGFHMNSSGTAPTITGSTLTANHTGVYLQGSASNEQLNPKPVVTGNSIYDNTSYNYYTRGYANAAGTTLDATGNWWGSVDPGVIAAKIYDHSDHSSSPVVNFGGYLNGDGGTSSEIGAGIGGSIGDATVLVPGKTYLALHSLTVPVGETLTIPAGVRLVFWSSNHGLTVNGTLDIQGTVDSPVTFTSANAVPAAGDW